jgi:type I restriction enzyme R subunit
VGFGNEAGVQAVRGDARRAVDEIVRIVRFPGWQSTIAGEREVKLALRKTLWKYKLHQDQDLFDRAYAYIKEYY